MILMTIQDDEHVDDGDLVRLLDGECGLEEDRLIRQHLTRCPECKSMLNSVSQLAQRFSALFMAFDDQLQRSDAPAVPTTPNRWLTVLRHWWARRSTRLVVAVATILLLLSAAAPVRALVLAGWRALQTLVIGARLDSRDTVGYRL